MAEMTTIVTPETLLRLDRKRGTIANILKLNGIEPMILFGEDSLWTGVREFLAHYHGQRNHQCIGSLSLILRIIRDFDSSLAADAQTATRGPSPENPEDSRCYKFRRTPVSLMARSEGNLSRSRRVPRPMPACEAAAQIRDEASQRHLEPSGGHRR
jgi:hypothetical protein